MSTVSVRLQYLERAGGPTFDRVNKASEPAVENRGRWRMRRGTRTGGPFGKKGDVVYTKDGGGGEIQNCI